jgi:2-haloalkanoic acid dehalogenase type II
MGTCLDWHSSITPVLRKALDQAANAKDFIQPTNKEASNLALDWRQGFFNEIHARFEAGDPPEDIDTTHKRVLQRLLSEPKWERYVNMPDSAIDTCVAAWHRQQAWPDVLAALPELKRECDVVVLANGTTRLQLDITKSSGLSFDILFSSELLDMTKPDPAIYARAMQLLRRQPSECIMVAAHAYDLRAAKRVGMRTAYLQRWTEDLHEDMAVVKSENDFFIDSRDATFSSGGLLELVELLMKT